MAIADILCGFRNISESVPLNGCGVSCQRNSNGPRSAATVRSHGLFARTFLYGYDGLPSLSNHPHAFKNTHHSPAWAICAALLSLCSPAGVLADDSAALEPLDVHARTSLTIVEQLRHNHYLRKTLDDAASSEIFDNYLEALDGARVYFTATDGPPWKSTAMNLTMRSSAAISARPSTCSTATNSG